MGTLRVVRGSADDPGIGELLYPAIGGGRGRVSAVLARYREDPRARLLVVVDRSDALGVIGFHVGDDVVTVMHIATVATRRRDGLGRHLMTELRARCPGRGVVAETDAESVGFYRALGFTTVSLGQRYSGVERFRVSLAADSRGSGPA